MFPANPQFPPLHMPSNLIHLVDGDPSYYELTPEGYQHVMEVDTPHALHIKIRILANLGCSADAPGQFTFKDHKDGCCMNDHKAIDEYLMQAVQDLGLQMVDMDELSVKMKDRFWATYQDFHFMASTAPDFSDSNVMKEPFRIMNEHDDLTMLKPGGDDVFACVKALARNNCTGCHLALGNQLGHMEGCLMPATTAVPMYFGTAVNDLGYVIEDDFVLFARCMAMARAEQ